MDFLSKKPKKGGGFKSWLCPWPHLQLYDCRHGYWEQAYDN